MTFQGTFIVFAELPQYIIKKQERKIFMTKSLQELLDEAALAVQPVLDELLKEIEEDE
jgi:hypothetical protein